MKRFALVLTLAASLAAISSVAIAKSGTSYKTTSTLEVKKKTITGKLTSPKAACVKNRTVIGGWEAPGSHLITEPAKSDGSGKWVIQFEVSPGSKGRLSIEVKPKRLNASTLCKATVTGMEVLGK